MSDNNSTAKKTRVGVIQLTYACEIGRDCTDQAEIERGIEKNVEHCCNLIAQAAAKGIEIVGLPEDEIGLAPMATFGKDKSILPGLVTQMQDWVLQTFRNAAKQAGIHVVASWYVTEFDKMFNVAHLIGSDGQLIGKYRKTHIPPGEADVFSAGDAYPVFETQFGRVGMVICWDMMFPEPCRILMLNGADIIFDPTLGFDFGGDMMGEMRIRTRAFDNAVNIVLAMPAGPERAGPGRSCIISADGCILADAGREPNNIVFIDIDLRKKPIDSCDTEGKEGLDMRGRWIKDRRPETYGRMVRTNNQNT